MLLDTKDVDHFDMNDFKKFRHDLNFSLSDTNKQDGAENLIPRQMIPETNDKSKNKRGHELPFHVAFTSRNELVKHKFTICKDRPFMLH